MNTTPICPRCAAELPPGAVFCPMCGRRLDKQKQRSKSRGNGQGTVFKDGNKYIAKKRVYYIGDDGKQHVHGIQKTFAKKSDAIAALPSLTVAKKKPRQTNLTWKELYDAWLPTCTAGESTVGNYRAAMKHFADLWYVPAAEIEIDDLQDCIDACPCGKATRHNMKTLAGLLCKYGVPRGYLPHKLILSDYLNVTGESGSGGQGLPEEYVTAIAASVGRVPGADVVLAHCYLGFRPSELLALKRENYDPTQRIFTGGAKTEAGKNRVVTVSPKIQAIVDAKAAQNPAQVFSAPDGSTQDLKQYRTLFYGVLDTLGLPNPTYTVQGNEKHTYTPHSCRHTFATMLKRVQGADKDKLALIGHSSDAMLRYYQDVNLDDRRRITDML